MRLALLGSVALILPFLAAEAKPFDLYRHKPYAVVRAKLIQNGYRPLRFRHQSDPCPDGQTFCVRFPEVISCSGTGLAMCEFAFFRTGDRKYFAVSTTGEERPYFYGIRWVTDRERKEAWDPEAR